ncbi:MAG TPA: GNAT family N-acetyltransferase [Candidatus Limnocylindrales bacterium]|nr:GNAT family N-acetyltransferase [Candidatus Limnocylindrales bacterium]
MSSVDSNAGQSTGVRVSTDPLDLDVDWVVAALSKRAYWALGRPRDVIEASIRGSLCFGAYRDGRQVGFARVVTDFATFGWVCDVFVDESARGHGIGGELMRAITTHPDLRDLNRLVLSTRDAHHFYEEFGFAPLDTPERWMIRRSSQR